MLTKEIMEELLKEQIKYGGILFHKALSEEEVKQYYDFAKERIDLCPKCNGKYRFAIPTEDNYCTFCKGSGLIDTLATPTTNENKI